MVEYSHAHDSQMYKKIMDRVYEFIHMVREKSMLDLFNEHVMSKYNGKADLDLFSDRETLKMKFDDEKDYIMFLMNEVR